MKNTWGGKRVGAGRKRKHEPVVTYSVHISQRHIELLKLWGGGSLDEGLRWLIDCAEPLVGPSVVVLKRSS